MSDLIPSDAPAERALQLLLDRNKVLVTAESCTAGLIAASLARIPGMSQCLAGGFVVYQTESKTAWLDIPETVIHEHGVVSRQVAELMAVCALARTPHASLAISITGHLGPDAPPELDGIAWLGYADRTAATGSRRLVLRPGPQSLHSGPAQAVPSSVQIRRLRQSDAALQAIQFLVEQIEHRP